jgi:hypothetical protein
MVPIKFQDQNELLGLSPKDLQSKIIEICEGHHSENKALAFAFILFDFDSPQVSKVLSDFKYWKALDMISGNYLSIFHLHTKEELFAEDLRRFDGTVFKGLQNLGIGPSVLAKLKFFIEPGEDVRTPSILFFQTDGKFVSDYYVVELKEEKVENSFIEIKTYIKAAVDSISNVTAENRGNRQPIFKLIESGLKSEQLMKKFNKQINAFPLNLFLGWLLGVPNFRQL